MPLRRKVIFLALCALIPAASASAKEPQTVDLGKAGKAAVVLDESDGASLVIQLPNGKIQSEQGIGDEFVPLQFNGKKVFLAAVDFDGDGVQEFVVRATIPPISGILFVYRWSPKEQKFLPLRFAEDEFLPVDIAAPVTVSKGEIKAHVIVRSTENEEFKVKESSWTWHNGAFAKQ